MRTSKPTGHDTVTIERLEQILGRVERTEDGCWQWCGATTAKGYAEVWAGKGVIYVHRLIYELVHGLIPQNFVVDHECNRTGCINPRHLRLLSNAENIWRKYEHSPILFCKRGHTIADDFKKETNNRNGRLRRRCGKCYRKEY